MARTELVVDGTNIAWAWARSRPHLLRKDHAGAQRLLVLTTSHSALRAVHQELTFVFDGPAPPGGPSSEAGVRVLYPDLGQNADQRILELVDQAVHAGVSVVVATSDRALRDLVRRQGGSTIGGQELILKIDPRSVTEPSRGGAASHREVDEKPGPSPHDTENWVRRFSRKKPPA
ncbi:MAG: NYN domain-containing protein [Candidatus Dormiibacterota bacterium]